MQYLSPIYTMLQFFRHKALIQLKDFIEVTSTLG